MDCFRRSNRQLSPSDIWSGLYDAIRHGDLASCERYTKAAKHLMAKPHRVQPGYFNNLLEHMIDSQASIEMFTNFIESKIADINGLAYRDPNPHDRNHVTALMYAIYRGNTELAKLLLDKGADVNIVDQEGGTALTYAANQSNIELAKLLLDKGADVNAVNYSKQTALMYAAHGGDVELAKLLLDNGADVNIIDQDEQTALMYAAHGGDVELAKLLLDKDTDINAANRYERTALMYAARRGNTELAKLLLDKGAEVDAVDQHQQTALMYAVQDSSLGVTELLLQRGANPNTISAEKETPMLRCCSMYRGSSSEDVNTQIMRLLAREGANIFLRIKRGDYNFPSIAESLSTRGDWGMLTQLVRECDRGNHLTTQHRAILQGLYDVAHQEFGRIFDRSLAGDPLPPRAEPYSEDDELYNRRLSLLLGDPALSASQRLSYVSLAAPHSSHVESPDDHWSHVGVAPSDDGNAKSYNLCEALKSFLAAMVELGVAPNPASIASAAASSQDPTPTHLPRTTRFRGDTYNHALSTIPEGTLPFAGSDVPPRRTAISLASRIRGDGRKSPTTIVTHL